MLGVFIFFLIYYLQFTPDSYRDYNWVDELYLRQSKSNKTI